MPGGGDELQLWRELERARRLGQWLRRTPREPAIERQLPDRADSVQRYLLGVDRNTLPDEKRGVPGVIFVPVRQNRPVRPFPLQVLGQLYACRRVAAIDHDAAHE